MIIPGTSAFAVDGASKGAIRIARAQTVISGLLADQLALHGLLAKIRDLGLRLISVRRLDFRHQPARH